MTPFTPDDLAAALRFGWQSAHGLPAHLGGQRHWNDIGERIHGMRLLIDEWAPDDPADKEARRELEEALKLLAGIAARHSVNAWLKVAEAA